MTLDNSINLIATITGIAPVFDRLTTDGKKFSKIGLIFSTIHISILWYIYSKDGRMNMILRIILNNVMYAMTTLKRLVDLWLPLIFIAGSIYQFSAIDKLWNKLDKFDAYLTENNQNVKLIETKLRKMKILILLGVLFGTILCVLSVCSYTALFESLKPEHFYKGSVYYANFILITLKVCKYFCGISLRIDLFKQVLGDIKFRQSNRLLDALPRYQLKIRM